MNECFFAIFLQSKRTKIFLKREITISSFWFFLIHFFSGVPSAQFLLGIFLFSTKNVCIYLGHKFNISGRHDSQMKFNVFLLRCCCCCRWVLLLLLAAATAIQEQRQCTNNKPKFCFCRAHSITIQFSFNEFELFLKK